MEGSLPGDEKQESVRITRADLRNAWPLQTNKDSVQKMQQDDPDLGPIYKWFSTDNRPSNAELTASSPATRHIMLFWDKLKVQNGILFRQFHKKDGSATYLQMLVPRKLKKEVLQAMHDAPLSGHLGIKKTREKILQRYYWFQLRDDIEGYVRKCDIFMSIKGPGQKPVKAPLGEMPTGAPLDRLSTDILGPLPETQRGNKFIMVVTDHFTRWVEIFALPDQTAEVCADKLVNEVIARFGTPYDLHSDQGRNYVSTLFIEMCKLLEVRKTRTSPYNPRLQWSM